MPHINVMSKRGVDRPCGIWGLSFPLTLIGAVQVVYECSDNLSINGILDEMVLLQIMKNCESLEVSK